MAGLCIVVASYLGDRRSGVSGYELLETQIRLLGPLQSPRVDRVYIVISGDFDPERLAPLHAQARQYPQLELLYRENGGFSYGGWNHAIRHALLTRDYEGDYFLIEDDYCIISPEFMEPYYKGKRHAYVCQLVFDDPVRHAAVSNGLLNGAVARNVLVETGTVFQLDTGGYADHYHGGEHIQKYYLTGIEAYCQHHAIPFLADVSAYSRILFYDQNVRAVKYYGHADMPSLIVPYEHWKTRHESLATPG